MQWDGLGMSLSIPLPWKVTYYDINNDSVGVNWQRFYIGWRVRDSVLHIRIGYRFQPMRDGTGIKP